MKQKKTHISKPLAYLAYKLGALPFALQLNDILLRPSADVEPLYEWIVAEGQRAVDALQSLLKEGANTTKAEAAKLAIAARLDDLLLARRQSQKKAEEAASGSKRAKKSDQTQEKRAAAISDEAYRPSYIYVMGDSGPEKWEESDVYSFVTIWDAQWDGFAAIIDVFLRTLPKSYREFAVIGSMLTDVITWTPRPEDKRREPIKEVAITQSWVCWMAAEHAMLVGLCLDLSRDAYYASDEDCQYLQWVKEKAKWLHIAIIERLGGSRSADLFTHTWISGTEALDLAQGFEVKLKLLG